MFVIPPVSIRFCTSYSFKHFLSLDSEKRKHNADNNGKKPEQTPGENNGARALGMITAIGYYIVITLL